MKASQSGPNSFFTVACVDPPIVAFTSVGKKDSLRNIEQTGQFVVNFAPESMFEQVNASGTDFAPDVSEFDAVGIEREPSVRVGPSRVAGSPIALECVLHSTIPLGDSTLVLGRVVLAAVDAMYSTAPIRTSSDSGRWPGWVATSGRCWVRSARSRGSVETTRRAITPLNCPTRTRPLQ